MSVTVLSPVGINRVEARPISARIASLEGADLGILINNKPNSEFLQDQITALLRERYKIGKVHKKIKPNASVGAKGLDLFAKEVKAVITAIGDWGSCTSWCIHDSYDLEKLGIPTVTVCTEAFIGLAKEESRTLGMPDLPLAIIRHPLGGESREAVAERAKLALDQVIHGLLRAPR